MQTNFYGRDFITDLDFTKEEIDTILDVAWDLKMKRSTRQPTPYLRDKTMALLFFFSSTRTRSAFESAFAHLGGHPAFIESTSTQISHGDTEREIGQILGRMYDGIAIRHCDWGLGNRYINLVAEASPTPVFNMQCEYYHPFQILADLMTIMEKKGRNLKRKKVVMSWAYAESYQKPLSIPNSMALQFPRFGLDFVLAHPPEFKLPEETIERGKEEARKSGGSFEIIEDMEEAFKGADVIYPKSWGPWMVTTDANQAGEIIRKYKHWITDERKMALAKDDAIFMHPLPADRGVEVTDGVIDGPNSVVFDEAENKLHICSAVYALTM
ncbi:MAG: ornithine carbamoyltransferase [Chloroflexi bacterium 44-23]|nr:MAG: ornithine carbamoyltransferase [Chloroflexi bacterium 44-23]